MSVFHANPDYLTRPIPNPLRVLVEVLKTDPLVSTRATSGIFSTQLGRSIENAMPTACVLLAGSGGRPLSEEVPMWRWRIRANCYGGPDTASQMGMTNALHMALGVMRALDNRGPFVSEEAVVSQVVVTAGPIEARDTSMNGAVMQVLYLMAFVPMVPVTGGT